MSIKLSDALDQMQTRTTEGLAPVFDLSAYSFNKRTRKGGKLRELRAVRLTTASLKKPAPSSGRVTSPARGLRFSSPILRLVLPDGSTTTVHKRLISEFNGQIVHY